MKKGFRKYVPALLLLVAVVFLVESGRERRSAEMGEVVDVTDATFADAVEAAPSWVVVDFQAAWCGRCRALSPILAEMAAKYEGRIKFTTVDVDENPGLVDRFHVQSVPLVYLFKNGVVVDDFLGYRNREQVRAWLEAHLG